MRSVTVAPPMRRLAGWIVATLILAAGVDALADPGITVRYVDWALSVQLHGSYAGARYTVFRSGERAAGYVPVTSSDVLCIGDCSVRDAGAVPGATYYYRFDLLFGDGRSASYGPYAVTVPEQPLRARLTPNPGSGVTQVMLSVPGGRGDPPVEAEARIVDIQGRTVRLLYRGPLPRGITTLSWDGRGEGGQVLRSGIYFLRFASPLGQSVTHVVRIR